MRYFRVPLLGLVMAVAALPVLAVLLVIDGRGSASPGPYAWAENLSYATTCAEEDNINVPIFAPEAKSLRLVAIHPLYEVGVDNCAEDFSGCDAGSAAVGVEAADVCPELYNDGIDVIEVCVVPDWWRPFGMSVIVGDDIANGHYLRWYRKVAGENNWPQFLVLYQDGNMRLKPHPPEGRTDTCFGSSIIVGPAAPDTRPYIDIHDVDVSPGTSSLRITYRNGGVADLNLSVDRVSAVAQVVGYEATSNPIATFRSMWVTDGNSDADHVEAEQGNLPILGSWTSLAGPWWLFHREVRSTHNTSAPDILIELDSDADGWPDMDDNCPAWPNSDQSLPPWPVPTDDPDCDGFTDADEGDIGTDPLDACANTPDPNDEADDCWPPDWDDSQTVNLLDVLSFKPHFGAADPSDPKYDARFDLNMDGAVNLLDLLPFKPFFRLTCV
jgi:hypothetical protein